MGANRWNGLRRRWRGRLLLVRDQAAYRVPATSSCRRPAILGRRGAAVRERTVDRTVQNRRRLREGARTDRTTCERDLRPASLGRVLPPHTGGKPMLRLRTAV